MQAHVESHFLDIKSLSASSLQSLLQTTHYFATHPEPNSHKNILQSQTIANLFFETSTRTRCSFELAAQRLGAQVLNLNVSFSAAQKGETLLDTVRNLQAMNVSGFVIRHPASGAAHFLAQQLGNAAVVINAGDGWHEHPTQALADVYTISQHKPNFTRLKVAIVGDIKHSRVARSLVFALRLMQVPDIRLIAPKTLLPTVIEAEVYHNFDIGTQDVDVLIMLRIQQERLQGALLPSAKAFSAQYGLTMQRLQSLKPNALIMHPGPINRGIEMSSAVADSDQAVILQQVRHGVSARMAVLSSLFGVAP